MARYSEITDEEIISIITDLYEKTGKCPSVEDVRKIAKCGNVRVMPVLKRWKQENPPALSVSADESPLDDEIPDEVQTLTERLWKAALTYASEKVKSELEHNRSEHQKALSEIDRLEVEVQSIADAARAEVAEERRKTESALHRLGDAEGRIAELEKRIETSEAARKAAEAREQSAASAALAAEERYHALALTLANRPASTAKKTSPAGDV